MKLAAVATNGKDLVIWGLGETQEEALDDARRWLAEAPCATPETALVIHVVTDAEAAAVAAGDVSWPPAVRP